MGIINIDIENLFVSKKQRKLNKLKNFLQKVKIHTEIRLVEFYINEGYYILNSAVSEGIGQGNPIKQPLSGKGYIYTPDSDKRYIVMSVEEMSELVELFKEAIDCKE